MDENKARDADRQAAEAQARERKRERRRRIFSRFAKVVTGFVVVSLTATEAMMFVMFGRTTPAVDAPFPIEDWAARNDCAFRPFEFMSGGNRLKGYAISGPDPRALMIVVHGIKSSSDAFEPIVKRYVGEGYAVLTFDGTASGRSEGSRTVGLQQQSQDLRALLDYAREENLYQDLPLVLFGHSAGAYGVAVEAGRAGARAAVCISGFESPLKTMRFWADHYAGMLTNIEYPFLWLREHAVKGRDANVSGSAAVLASGIPTLVVHGAADDVIRQEISLYEALIEKNAPNVECLLEDAHDFCGHSDILIAGDRMNETLLDYIDGFLSSQIDLQRDS